MDQITFRFNELVQKVLRDFQMWQIESKHLACNGWRSIRSNDKANTIDVMAGHHLNVNNPDEEEDSKGPDNTLYSPYGVNYRCGLVWWVGSSGPHWLWNLFSSLFSTWLHETWTDWEDSAKAIMGVGRDIWWILRRKTTTISRVIQLNGARLEKHLKLYILIMKRI